jgi:ATP-dependent Clp protease ATP-binding subunit ClpA
MERESLEPMNNFTPRAQQVLALARKEADRFNHNFVGTEHLLLGLIRLGQGTGFIVLQKMGLDLENVRLEVEKQVGTGPDQKLIGNIPYTPRVKKVLALAAKEARALNHTYVGTEHILLGLLREGDGVAPRVLKNFNVDTEVTRQHILRELDPNFSATKTDEETQGRAKRRKPEDDTIDTTKRYDVYCSEHNQEVVYRNLLFKGRKTLLQRHEHDISSDFIELEQSNGSTIFISRHSLVKFCEHGVTPSPEPASGAQH